MRRFSLCLCLTAAAWALGPATTAPPWRAMAEPDEEEEDEEEEDEDEDAEQEGAEEEDPAPAPADPQVKDALDELLVVGHRLLPGNVLDATYSLTDGVEVDDFLSKGFDKVEIHEVSGAGGRSDTGLELGAGSRKAGTLMHKVTFKGDFEIEVEMWAAHNTPSAILCVLLSKKVGVSWGQGLCKPTSLRLFNRGAKADPTEFREERTVRTKITCKDDVVTVMCNGRKVDERRFKKGELSQVRFGLVARNIRVVVSELRLRGAVDVEELNR